MSEVIPRLAEGWEKPTAVALWHWYNNLNVSACERVQLGEPGNRTIHRASPHDRCAECYELTR